MAASSRFDAIVVGGGPAGSAMAWSLATRGIKTAVLERESFPREKVCGDFIEPAGLRIVEAMGCGEALDLKSRPPITHNRVYFGPHVPYQGTIPYNLASHGLPPHGHIIPRDEFDTALLDNAENAGATVYRATAAESVERKDGMMHVALRGASKHSELTAPIVIGADGVQSLVAKSAGLRRTDKRHIGVSQRVYLEGVEIENNEAAIWFDEDHYPGYGWIFPMPGGRANMGVGLLSETCERFGLSVQSSFREAVERLRIRHPDCAGARIASKPLGGAVHTYGGITRNYFAGGLLVGDAGSFVDPMTGEGITQGMESAIIGARTVARALEKGLFEADDLAGFQDEFRAYFDPSMRYLCLCATLLRNRHFSELAFLATRRGFERAQRNADFGRVAGTTFGGLNVQPLAMVGQIWISIIEHLIAGGAQAAAKLLTGQDLDLGPLAHDLGAWRRGWSASAADDPAWHMAWLADIVRATLQFGPSLQVFQNPRLKGPFSEETPT